MNKVSFYIEIIKIIWSIIVYIMLCAKVASIAEDKKLAGYFWLSMITTPVAGYFLLYLEGKNR